ncbi:orotidine-5'-phosphate decarboxylase [Swaminathania salitolerans]|uniref:Orotidine 5'-phosphate decarboxylase n=1 Tax=Swaminathania salitolerans TaxID=182838 RepID=A0A511BUW4_9PROT|nr:orotidine-5'-phosphate decarboxylase [Swaminathania salitolerans]GBQ13299.1 orotidine 5'-phosphate decarboxylase [Swaminathania salitolerans LMG 21291]GEL03274.1 orotidine 5'-phosphate decarboxylase [Swaminathania salitolerans]
MKRTRLIAALDTQDLDQARSWAARLDGHVDAIKLGLEFTYAQGLAAVRDVAAERTLFLDLKLHDIPNTVAKGLTSLAPIGPALLTIHASGGAAMIRAARQAIDAAYPPLHRPILLAVTVLTSLDAAALRETGIDATPRDQVLRLGKLAMTSGADGLVCSAEEIAPLRDALGESPVLVVPGIRPAGSAADDQKRIMTPHQAARAGADWIVVGRPITQAADPAAAAAAIQAELAGI